MKVDGTLDRGLTQAGYSRLTAEQLEKMRARLAQRAPDTAFSAAEAAIYTGRSTRTLKRAIDAGMGPRREKNPDVTGLGATNRHTRYRKADLDAWRSSLVAFAVDFRGFDDLATDAPWVIDGERILGHLLDLDDIEAVLDALSAEAIVFLRLDEALQWVWVSRDLRSTYQEAFASIARGTMQELEDAAQRDALDADTGPAVGRSKGPLRP